MSSIFMQFKIQKSTEYGTPYPYPPACSSWIFKIILFLSFWTAPRQMEFPGRGSDPSHNCLWSPETLDLLPLIPLCHSGTDKVVFVLFQWVS